MHHFFRLFVLGFVLVFVAPSSYAQKSRTALEKQKSKIRKEIDYKNQLLKETKKTKKKSLNQLILVRKKIKNRENLISPSINCISDLNVEIKFSRFLIFLRTKIN